MSLWIFFSIDIEKREHLFNAIFFIIHQQGRAVVKCLTRDRGVAGSSLTGVYALCP